MFVVLFKHERNGAMESKYYNLEDIKMITGLSEIEAYKIIEKLNNELKLIYKNYQLKPVIKQGLVAKDYFIKRMEIGI